MGHVEKVYTTETAFFSDIIVGGFRLTFSAPVAALRGGASLIALKNAWVREVIQTGGGAVNAADLRATAKEMVVVMRDEIESFFQEEAQHEDA